MWRFIKVFGVFLAIITIFTSIQAPQVKALTPPTDTNDKLNSAVVLYVGSPQALIKGVETQVDPTNSQVYPVIENGRTLVPVRFISEGLGAQVVWDGKTSSVNVTSGKTSIVLSVGSGIMKVNGKSVSLDTPTEVLNDRIFIPLRQLVEALGKKVFYDRGLIVISDTDNFSDLASDRSVVDNIIFRVNNLPSVGSRDALEKLLSQFTNEGSDLRKNMKARGVMDEGMASPASAVSEAKADAAKTAETAPVAGSGDYSTTNVQVQGVDEADIVKTDGEYIYQVNKNRIVATKAYPADEMKICGIVDFNGKGFIPEELYLDGQRMVVIGQSYGDIVQGKTDAKQSVEANRPVYAQRTVKAIIYDITDRTDFKKLREVELEGNYVSSRKIGSNLYIVANRYIEYYRPQSGSENILPTYRDTVLSNEPITVDCSEIRYFPGFCEPNYMMVASVDLNNPDEKMKVYTYLGAGQNIYSSLQNLYVAAVGYDNSGIRPMQAAEKKKSGLLKPTIMPNTEEYTLVYKFSLDNGKVTYLNKGKVPGSILNQFSMDENGRFFRIAATLGNVWGSGESISKNNVYILDETMSIAGRIEDIAPGERIYSVRFMGNRGYVVTFKNVDPLFVIDLKDPYNPSVLGALKIPGYSDYLHPYDENHIMGFGKDTVEIPSKGGDGSLVSGTAFYQGMKIAIFDVSDVKNPKQMFSQVIGDRGTDSELLRNHRALLFSKDRNLLAFPVTVMEIDKNAQGTGVKTGIPEYGRFTFQGAYVYHVDLVNGFSLKGKVTHIPDEVYKKSGDQWYNSDRNIERIIYINDMLYTLSKGMIKANNLNDLKEINALQIP